MNRTLENISQEEARFLMEQLAQYRAYQKGELAFIDKEFKKYMDEREG